MFVVLEGAREGWSASWNWLASPFPASTFASLSYPLRPDLLLLTCFLLRLRASACFWIWSSVFCYCACTWHCSQYFDKYIRSVLFGLSISLHNVGQRHSLHLCTLRARLSHCLLACDVPHPSNLHGTLSSCAQPRFTLRC